MLEDSSPSSPGVLFSPAGCGLPGGDMQLGRTANIPGPTVESDDTSTNEDRSGVVAPQPSLTYPQEEVPPHAPLDENGHKYVGLINQVGVPQQWEIIYESYDQHDVQELCRLMFDALELKWKDVCCVINEFRGKMQDFVKCLKCGRENVRPDVFLDLPLAVKPFGAVEAFHSVEEALRAFITPELLDGSNQYFCESCNSKQDAHKGLRITEFPYLLTIQLKRFDFDYNTMHRIKLNDRMTFPDVLDLNPFVSSPSMCDDMLPHGESPGSAANSEAFIVGQQLDRDHVNKLLKRGEYVYELFSVMVHQGSAAGGHYFAHIKNMDQGRWYCFNDTRVEPVGPEEISKSFGGSYGGWSTSNTNAYMLMYRKINKLNANFIRTPDLPHHITQLKSQWREQEAERERQRIYQMNLVNIKVHLNMVSDNEAILSKQFVIDMPRSNTLCDIYNQ
ncbi:ubiquitinyl hydrolase 1, partial [Ancylostoma duodenale]